MVFKKLTMFRASACLCIIAVFVTTLTSLCQVHCPEWETLITSTEFTFPNFDRSRNTSFSELYVASFGDSINLVDWKVQRRIGEHLIIAGKKRSSAAIASTYYPSSS